MLAKIDLWGGASFIGIFMVLEGLVAAIKVFLSINDFAGIVVRDCSMKGQL